MERDWWTFKEFIAGSLNGPVLFCSLSSSVTLPAGGLGTWAIGQPALHGGPVVLRPIRATPCMGNITCDGLI